MIGVPDPTWDPASWMNHAPCRGLSADFFFPERGELTTEAQAVCNGCPFRKRCLDYALSQGGLVPGIWGGTSERQRRGMARRPPKARERHGTAAGYTAETRRGVPHCHGCLEAHTQASLLRRDQARIAAGGAE